MALLISTVQVVGDIETTLPYTLEELGISLNRSELQMNMRELLRTVCKKFFGEHCGLVEMIARHVPAPTAGARDKITSSYTGDLSTEVARGMLACDPSGPVMVHVTKLYSSEDGTVFHAFGRVMGGTLQAGEEVRVLGEGYTLEDEEDSAIATVGRLWILEARYRIQVHIDLVLSC